LLLRKRGCGVGGYYMDKITDGIYVDIFVVKCGKRYPLKTINGKDVSKILVENLMNGIDEIVCRAKDLDE
jgi:hypothetical protein